MAQLSRLRPAHDPVCGRSTVTRRVSSRAGAPPSPRALPSFQAGCSRQRESSSVRRRAGLPMLLREVGSSRDVRACPARVLGRRGWFRRSRWSVCCWGWVHAACCSGVAPAAMPGSQLTRRVTTTWIQRSRAAAQAVRACWRASRFSSRVVRWVNRAAITGLFGSAAQTARQAATRSRAGRGQRSRSCPGRCRRRCRAGTARRA